MYGLCQHRRYFLLPTSVAALSQSNAKSREVILEIREVRLDATRVLLVHRRPIIFKYGISIDKGDGVFSLSSRGNAATLLLSTPDVEVQVG